MWYVSLTSAALGCPNRRLELKKMYQQWGRTTHVFIQSEVTTENVCAEINGTMGAHPTINHS